ncbi:MAG: hypothetical protein AAF404_02210 [Pseudomonadota bacterium]
MICTTIRKLPLGGLRTVLALLLFPFLSACIAEQDITQVELKNAEDTRIVYLAFEVVTLTLPFVLPTIAQEESMNVLRDEGIAPGETRRFERSCMFNPQYLNLRWEDGTKRYYRIATPCGKRIVYNLLQNN